MPEGPEVRTLVDELNQKVVGKKIQSIIFASTADKLIANLPQQDFINLFTSQTISQVQRHGKYIDFKFSNDFHVILHLLITGRLSLLMSDDTNYPRYFRCAFVFEDGTKLCLGDRRQWTKLHVVQDIEIETYERFASQGVDVFSDEFDEAILSQILKKSQAIHALLLDQKKISGLGNIYVNEVLFLTGIHPQAKAQSVIREKISTLYQHIKDIMQLAFDERGTTIEAFLERDSGAVGWHTLDGKPGNFWKHVKIFQKEGKPCPNCGTLIKRTTVGSRSAFFCEICQPL